MVIEELGFGSHEERLDKYFKDKVYSVTNKIHRAEDLISRKTGRIFTVNSRDWEIYNDTVIKQAALFILAIMRNYENNNVSVAVEGAVRFDKTQWGRQLSSITQRLKNEVTENIDLLTRTTLQTVAIVRRRAV